MHQTYAIIIRCHTRASSISTNGILGVIVMRGSPRVARLAAGGSSAERRVQGVFTAMQTSISFDAGTRGLL